MHHISIYHIYTPLPSFTPHLHLILCLHPYNKSKLLHSVSYLHLIFNSVSSKMYGESLGNMKQFSANSDSGEGLPQYAIITAWVLGSLTKFF